MSTKFKNIRITTYGQIPIMGGVAGPILTPFRCDVDKIGHLIVLRVDVEEVIYINGEEHSIALDLYNYNSDNYSKIAKSLKHQPKPEPVVEEPMVEEQPVDVVEEQKPQQKHHNNKQKNKK